jgi:tripartite-type tricarboxylate transporter receptor subunit TctC
VKAILVSRRAILGNAAALCAASLGMPALAGAYPDHPIRLIVPFPPGGPNDIVARLLSQRLPERLGQPVVVDNRAGGSTIIGTRLAAQAAADGYTLLMVSPSHVINPGLRTDLPYDLLRDFVPIIEIAESPNVLVVNATAPIKSLADLIAMAKANPGKINYGSGGPGTATHLAGAMLCAMAGVTMNHVPYKGDGPATIDLLAGQITWKFGTILSTKPFVDSGRLRAIAVSGLKRVGALPDVPTVAETIPGFEATSLYGVVTQRGTPQAIVDRLNRELQAVVEDPDFKRVIAEDGGTVIGGQPSAFAARLKDLIEKWRKVIQEGHISAE